MVDDYPTRASNDEQHFANGYTDSQQDTAELSSKQREFLDSLGFLLDVSIYAIALRELLSRFSSLPEMSEQNVWWCMFALLNLSVLLSFEIKNNRDRVKKNLAGSALTQDAKDQILLIQNTSRRDNDWRIGINLFAALLAANHMPDAALLFAASATFLTKKIDAFGRL